MESPQWLVSTRESAGQRLAVRLRPSSVVASAREKFGYLLVITQHLTDVRADGMPEADYNDSLRDFDGELIDQLEMDGLVVVVETYTGKRIYYAYVAEELSAKGRATKALSDYGHLAESNFRGGADPSWAFYARYTAAVT